MPIARRRKIGHRRRVEDEGEEEGGPDALDLEDDSLSDDSIATDDHDAGDDSDTSNIDDSSPTAHNGKKKMNGNADAGGKSNRQDAERGLGNKTTDTEIMLRGLTISDQAPFSQEMPFDEVAATPDRRSPTAPIVVSSASAVRAPADVPGVRRRQEHEDYKKRRDEDPAFVPNRGSFFMHDHRHPGPAANGFRPFGRGRGRGGRGGFGGPFAPMSHLHHPGDPTTSSPWAHDMHDTIADGGPRRHHPGPPVQGHPVNNAIPTCSPSKEPINRTLSTEKFIGKAPVRVMVPPLTNPVILPSMPIKQYTKLPDHRPPLRRDKPVRISLPDHGPRYIFPAVDRSFVFIPRAMRPNQQRIRGKGRSGFGSAGGYSRRTSVFGGSIYGGSVYSPSVALSRRSSIAYDRENVFSPTASVASRAPVPTEPAKPVVRLPPRPDLPGAAPPLDMAAQVLQPEGLMNHLPQPQIHALPQKPGMQESQAAPLPMHQPRPQKNISVANIDSADLSQGSPAFQGAFYHQMPVQVTNGLARENHARRPSHPSQHSGGTPLSQIPERAIHAAPFQPNMYGQQQPHIQHPYYHQHQSSYSMPPPPPPPQGFYYPPPNMPNTLANGFPPSGQAEAAPGHSPNAPPAPGMVAQEANGMVYYYDPAQVGQVNPYSSYPPNQPYQPSVVGMGGMVTPSPDGYYFPQGASGHGTVYYQQ